eukprot:g4781.t1
MAFLARVGAVVKNEATKLMNTEAHREAKTKKYGVQWQAVSDVQQCNLCGLNFTLLRTKHHCRNCGRVCCKNCCATRMKVRGSVHPKRVCKNCKTQLQKAGGKLMTENDRLEESVAAPLQDISSLPTHVEDIAITHPGNEKMQVGDICSCDFGGAVANSGEAVWFRAKQPMVGPKDEGVRITSCALNVAMDTVYTATAADVGFFLCCKVSVPGQQTLVASSQTTVQKAMPGLHRVRAELRPHKHTLRCDRTERVCDAVGKYREGETMYMTVDTKGIAGDVSLRCTWYRTRRTHEEVRKGIRQHPQQQRQQKSRQQEHLNKGKEGGGENVVVKKDTKANVLFDFEKSDTYELTVKEGDVLQHVEIVNDEWIRGECVSTGKSGAVPLAYVSIFEEEEEVADDGIDEDVEGALEDLRAVSSGSVGQKEVEAEIKEVSALKSAAAWRADINAGDVHDMQMVSSIVCSPDDNPELALTVADVGKLIVVQVEVLEKFLPANGKPFVSKARSIAVGPIEPAPPRVDNLRIIQVDKNDEKVPGTVLMASYDWYGGVEGKTEYSYVRIRTDGSRVDIVKMTPTSHLVNGERMAEGTPPITDSRCYTLTEEDMGTKLKVKCRPVRVDGRRGQVFTSKVFRIPPPKTTEAAAPPVALDLRFAMSDPSGNRNRRAGRMSRVSRLAELKKGM